MLLYVIEKNMIINLNNIRTIKLDRDYSYTIVQAIGSNGEFFTICRCDNDNIGKKIINDIYTKMTYGNENIILDLEDYREEAEEDVNEEK